MMGFFLIYFIDPCTLLRIQTLGVDVQYIEHHDGAFAIDIWSYLHCVSIS